MMVFLALAGGVFALMQSLVAPALPVIAADLGASAGDVSWVMTVYLLAAAVGTPIAGRLGDIFGKRRMLLVVLGLFAAGTLVSALAGSLAALLVGRIMQGAAGSVLPLSVGIVRDDLPPERVGVAVGVLSSIFGIGGGAGVVLAGPVVQYLSWEWLFWLPLAVAAVAFAGIAFGIRESSVRSRGRIDLAGALLLSAGLVCLLLALAKGAVWGWTSPATLGTFTGALFAFIALVVVERHVAEPLVDMRMLARRGVWTTNLVGLGFGFAMFANFLLVPQLLQLPAATGHGFGLSVSAAGLYLLPSTIGMIVFGPVSGILDRRYGSKTPLLIGTVLTAAAFVLPALGHSEPWQLLASSALMGVGLGLAMAAMSNAIIAAVPREQTGVATGVNTLARTVGGSIGTAAVAAVLTAGTGSGTTPTDAAFTSGFAAGAGVIAFALLAVLLLPRPATPPGARNAKPQPVPSE
ncbi:MFS transporter [Glycomyces sp. NPDC047369]